MSGIICRWLHADGNLILDAMPTDASILGFANRWQAASVPHALERERAELAEEIASAPAELREYLAAELARHRRHPRFLDGVYSGLTPDAASQDRAEGIVAARMAAVAAGWIDPL